jgi:glycosyltransferase involved in cell wall biosynthesis
MQGLRERGHEVMFLGSCPVLLEKAASDQLLASRLDIGPPPVTKGRAMSFLWRKQTMHKRLVEQVENLTAHSGELTAIFMLSLSEKLLLTDWAFAQGIKVFWIEHDRIGRWLTHNPWLPRLRRLSRRATTIVVSDLSRDLYLQLGWPSERVVSIPNGIDIRRFTPNPNPNPSPSPSPFRIGCLARLTADKGIDLLLDAIADLPAASLTIVGQGKEEDRIRTLMAKKLPPHRGELFAYSHDLPSFYHSLDALVLPSRSHDPFGLVVIEAMASGIPVIVTDACGVARHLQSDEALIVPAGNTGALRDAITLLQQDQKLRENLAKKGREVASQRFSLERMVREYEALLTPLRPPRPPSPSPQPST